MQKMFDSIIGQKNTKQTLTIYSKAYEKTNKIPFLNFVGAKGGGKTELAIAFGKTLGKPLLEVNAELIKKPETFFGDYYDVWSAEPATLFVDEAHNLSKPLQEIFLTILNTKRNSKKIRFEGASFTFDFSSMSILFATTDQQKLSEPLNDRLTAISLEPYSEEELYQIFLLNLQEDIKIDGAQSLISNCFRGNPRDAVKKAQALNSFCCALNKTSVTCKVWHKFMSNMSVGQLGLENAEKLILEVLGRTGNQTLSAIASMTGFSPQVIRRDYEQVLLRKGLIKIDGKRKLTKAGKDFFRQFCH